jgi:hypothetical protein
VLEASVAGYTAPFWLAQRARIVLLAETPQIAWRPDLKG